MQWTQSWCSPVLARERRRSTFATTRAALLSRSNSSTATSASRKMCTLTTSPWESTRWSTSTNWSGSTWKKSWRPWWLMAAKFKKDSSASYTCARSSWSQLPENSKCRLSLLQGILTLWWSNAKSLMKFTHRSSKSWFQAAKFLRCSSTTKGWQQLNLP